MTDKTITSATERAENGPLIANMTTGSREHAAAATEQPMTAPSPMTSFEDTGHAYEAGYAQGQADMRGAAIGCIRSDMADLCEYMTDPVRVLAYGSAIEAMDHSAGKISALPAHHIGDANKMAAPAVTVKPLVWASYNDKYNGGRSYYGTGIFGHWYCASRAKNCEWLLMHHADGKPRHFLPFPSLDAAKAAAQADYEARILAALEGGAA